MTEPLIINIFVLIYKGCGCWNNKKIKMQQTNQMVTLIMIYLSQHFLFLHFQIQQGKDLRRS